ncbi:MAG: aldo/keto reductase, partial [Oscillospiraceae bacterium]
LGMGCMRLPQDKSGKIINSEVNAMAEICMEHGVNYFDTSFVYHEGESETALGIALSPFDRRDYFLADKMSLWKVNSIADMDEQLELSLKKLKTSYIDFYLFHSMDEKYIKKLVALDGISWAKQKLAEGKIRHLGFSIHAPLKNLRELLDLYPFEFVQIQYNYMDEDDDPGTKGYEELTSRNIPVIVMEPLKGGFLTNLPEKITEPYREVGRSNAEIAFNWIRDHQGVALILSGMSSREQLNDNIKTFGNLTGLKEKEKAAILAVRKNIAAAQKVKCTGCKYCMPCPVGIDIPETFKRWNLASLQSQNDLTVTVNVDKEPLNKCKACKACMDKCPQKIDILSCFEEIKAGK